MKKIITKLNIITYLINKNKALEERISELEAKSKSPTALVASIMEKEPNWFDYEKLSPDEYVGYYNASRDLLSNSFFLNEKSRLSHEWAEWAVGGAKDFQSVRDMRMQISGINLLKERAEEMVHPDEYKKPKESLEDRIVREHLSV